MEIKYVIADPTGNITALVETPVQQRQQPNVAALLMERHPRVEQVGFLGHGPGCHISLRMAGGEFCGNAAMSAAAVCLSRRGPLDGEAAIRVRVSGASESVPVSVSPGQSGFVCCVQMPLPKSISVINFKLGSRVLRSPVVSFSGISHVIVPGNTDRAAAEPALRRWCSGEKLKAAGLMLLDESSLSLTPLVYVPEADTMFWESSCASGTSAVGAWLSERDGRDMSLSLSEPAGRLTVEARRGEGALCSLHLGGLVSIVSENILETVEI